MGDFNGSDDGLLLAQTLATRLCHDVSGQVNAIAGALEMMNDDPAMAADATELCHDASAALVRRLRLLRAAWGVSGAALAVTELRDILVGAFGRAVRLDLDALPQAGIFPPDAARLALNVVLLAAESLPTGGVVQVTGDPEHDLLVRISGPRAAWPHGLAGMLVDPAHARGSLRNADHTASARSVQAPLTALIAHASGLRLAFLIAPTAEAAPPLLVAMRQIH